VCRFWHQKQSEKKRTSLLLCFLIVSHSDFFFLSFYSRSTDKPFFKQPKKNAYGYMHGVSNLTCEAMAEPAANFTWYRNGKKISGKHYPVHHGNHVSILSVSLFVEIFDFI
jgi:hypothetical protein